MHRIYCLLAAIACMAMARAGNIISLSSAADVPAAEVTIQVCLSNTDAVSALEINLPLGNALQYVEGSCTLAAGRENGHSLVANQVGEQLRIYLYSLSLSPLQGNSGELLTFRLLIGKEPAAYPLQPEVVLSNAAGESVEASVQAGEVTILAPKLAILTSQIDYGHIPIRSVYTRTLQLQNTGTSLLTVQDIIINDTTFLPLATTLTIQPQATASVTLQYSPVVRGSISRSVQVMSDAVNGVQKANVIADPFSVNELHVGNTSGIADSIVTLSLTMNNMEPIVAVQCAFKLPKELVYITNSAKVAPDRNNGHLAFGTMKGDTLMLMLYAPDNAPLLLNDGEVLSFQLRLNGNSGTYYLYPKEVVLGNITEENMTSSTSYGYVRIQSPRLSCLTSLTFPATSVTDTARASIRIYNQGDAPLSLERATFLAESYAVEDTFPIVISPWNQIDLHIAYYPKQEGDFRTTMQLYTNDPTARMHSVALNGHIYEPNTITMDGSITAEGNYALTLSMENYSDIVAAQWEMQWMEGMVTATANLRPTTRLKNHAYAVSPLGETGYRVVVYSMTNQPIDGYEGELFTLTFEQQGEVDFCGSDIALTNVVLSNAKGVNKSSCTALYHTAIGMFLREDTVEAQNEYTWRGTTYTHSGIYRDTVSLLQGCDSVYVLHLTVLDNPSALSSAKESSMRPLVYPNPVKETAYLHWDTQNIPYSNNPCIMIYDSTGKCIYSATSRVSSIDVRGWHNGVYLMVCRQCGANRITTIERIIVE